MTESTLTYEEIAKLALNLPVADKLRLIERLATRVRYDVGSEPAVPRQSWRGLLADLGPAPSAEEIDEARREMWGGVFREDSAK